MCLVGWSNSCCSDLHHQTRDHWDTWVDQAGWITWQRSREENWARMEREGSRVVCCCTWWRRDRSWMMLLDKFVRTEESIHVGLLETRLTNRVSPTLTSVSTPATGMVENIWGNLSEPFLQIDIQTSRQWIRFQLWFLELQLDNDILTYSEAGPEDKLICIFVIFSTYMYDICTM